MVRAYTWDRLRRLSLARHFPKVRGTGETAVTGAVRRIGPIQAQTARSPFLCLAARLPGVTHEAITAAYESGRLLRGSSIRGTVHTSTAAHHRLLDVATREGQRVLWARQLNPQRHDVDQVRAIVETLAAGDWRTADDLRNRLRQWLLEHDSEIAAQQLADSAGRHFAIAHSALVRRPLRGGWEAQGRAGYRVVSDVVPGDIPERAALVADPAAALSALARVHLCVFGPATRRDLAWWAGIGLRQADAALETLRPEATVRPGPDGAEYWDLAEGMPRGIGDVGTRLLPEFDAVLVGYHPRARDRFVAPEHLSVLWTQANGLILPPVLHQGRVVGYWRLEGSGRRRRLRVSGFPGCPWPDEADLAEPIAAVTAAMNLEITDVMIGSHND